ncbi:MAG: hypothetical protein WDO73_08010 [Ignavibacteriota bacterium]
MKRRPSCKRCRTNRAPPPSSVEQGKILNEIREYVANYDNSLPDFICLEIEQRSIAPNHGAATATSRLPLDDTITSKITYFQHEEKKEPMLNGSRVVTSDYEKLGGATSRGDFETALRMLFDPPRRRGLNGRAGPRCAVAPPWCSTIASRRNARSIASAPASTRSNALPHTPARYLSMSNRRMR